MPLPEKKVLKPANRKETLVVHDLDTQGLIPPAL